MTTSQAFQLVGTFGIVVLALGLLDVARSVQRLTSFGREALVCVAIYLLLAAVVRMVVFLSLLDQEQGRIVNGMLAIPFVVILVQIVWIRKRVNGKGLSGAHDDT